MTPTTTSRYSFQYRARSAYLFLLVPLVLFTLFRNLPLLVAFIISLMDWDIVGSAKWVGFRHYLDLLKDHNFHTAFWNTIFFTVGTVPAAILGGLFFAMVIEARFIKFRAGFRTLFFLPVVSSMVAIATVWNWIYNPLFGILNQLTQQIGLGRFGWIADDRMALASIMVVAIWKTIGYNMIIYMAGLNGIPQVYYEAAAIDGATRWQSFRHVTWPMLRPVTIFLVVMGIINSFQVFDLVYVLTSGAMKDSTNVLVFYLYHKAFAEMNLGYASAIGYYIFILILGVTLVQFWSNRRKEG